MSEEAIVLLIRINNAQVEFVKRVKNLLVNSFMLLFFGRGGGELHFSILIIFKYGFMLLYISLIALFTCQLHFMHGVILTCLLLLQVPCSS